MDFPENLGDGTRWNPRELVYYIGFWGMASSTSGLGFMVDLDRLYVYHLPKICDDMHIPMLKGTPR